MKKKITISILILLLMTSVICIVGCQSKKRNGAKTFDNGYLVVVDRANMSLEKVEYNLKAKEAYSQAEELIKSLKRYQTDTYSSPFPEDVALNEWKLNDNLATLYFGNEYYNLAITDEVLCRAAIVETLCQVDGIDEVAFYVDETELSINNKIVGRMNADTFLYDDEVYDKYFDIILFFPNDSMDSLVKVERHVNSNGMYTDEQMVLTELLAGPKKSEEVKQSIPDGTKIINIVTKDKVCYVNLSAEFIDYLESVPDEITIYSIVNTLTEISGISSVVFSVEGEPIDYYRTIQCNGYFTYNYDLVEE